MATELVGIELQLIGEEAVYSDIQKLESLIRQVGGRKTIELDLRKTKQRLIEVNSEIEKYKRQLADSEEGSKQFEEASANIERLKREYKELNIRAKEYSTILKEHSSFAQVYNRITTQVNHLGSALISAGNAMKNFSRPFKHIMNGTLLAAGYKLLNVATSGLSGAAERYDTFKTFEKSLSALGYDAGKKFVLSTNEEMTALENLNEAVLGLPTGLDEIVGAMKRYLAASGSVETATQAAIAANNTFLAQGSNSRDQLRGARQIRNLLTGGEMTKARWQSILESMPMAVNAVGSELGYAEDEMQKFRKALLEGEIDSKKFLDAFLKVGTKGSIADATNVMKHTLGAATANIGNAFKRMGENIIKTLDEILLAGTGKDVIDYIIGIKDAINSFSTGVQDWIKANPDKILDFIETIKKINFKGFFEGVAKGLEFQIDLINKFLGLFGGKGMKALGYLMSVSSALSTPFIVVGGFLKGTRGIWGGLGALLVSGARALGIGGKGGLIGKILEFFGGKDVAKTVAEAPKMSTMLRNTFQSLQGVLTVAGQIAIPAVTGLVVVKSFKEVLKDLRSIGWLVQDIDWKSATKAMVAFGGFITAFAGAGYLVSRDLPAALDALQGTAVVGGISWLASFAVSETMRQIKSGVGFFKEMTESLNAITENLKNLKTTPMSGSIKKVGDMLGYLNTLTDSLAGTMVNGEQQGGLKLVPESVKLTVENLSAIITALGDISDKFKELDTNGFVDDAIIERIGTSLGKLIESLSNAFVNYVYGLDSETTGEITTAIGNINAMFDAITGPEGVLAKARNFVYETADIPGVTDPIVSATPKLTKMFENLSEIHNAFRKAKIGNTSNLLSNVQNFELVFESLRQIFKKMRKIQGYDMERVGTGGNVQYKAIEMIQNLIAQLKATFQSDTVNSLKSSIQEFVDSVSSLMDSVESLGGEHEIDASVKLKSDKVVGADKVVKAIEDAIKNIKNAWDKMPTTLTKTINLNLGGRVNASGYNSALGRAGVHVKNGTLMESAGGYASRNGVLYRANGGSIFKPRGTDRIPAMLTEGEYVHRREAVNKFGIDFMRRVNNLDVRGAMQALLNRDYSGTSIGRQSIVTTTVNDNRRVTQNINTNNPQFASMSAGRYAGAL